MLKGDVVLIWFSNKKKKETQKKPIKNHLTQVQAGFS